MSVSLLPSVVLLLSEAAVLPSLIVAQNMCFHFNDHLILMIASVVTSLTIFIVTLFCGRFLGEQSLLPPHIDLPKGDTAVVKNTMHSELNPRSEVTTHCDSLL